MGAAVLTPKRDVPALERQFVRLGRDGGLVTVELINSKPLNILGSGAIEELTQAFRAISQESDGRVVVHTATPR